MAIINNSPNARWIQGVLSIYVEKPVTNNFPPYGKTVVPLWNKMEWFFPLVILGNKPRISTRSMVRECDRGKWLSDIAVISVNFTPLFPLNGKRGGVRTYSFLSEKFPVGRTVPLFLLESVGVSSCRACSQH